MNGTSLQPKMMSKLIGWPVGRNASDSVSLILRPSFGMATEWSAEDAIGSLNLGFSYPNSGIVPGS